MFYKICFALLLFTGIPGIQGHIRNTDVKMLVRRAIVNFRVEMAVG